ncbi:unnamed protein product [Rhizophagus irregularis]|nr:unnamed protein product [Rhizophagus irregularis]
MYLDLLSRFLVGFIFQSGYINHHHHRFHEVLHIRYYGLIFVKINLVFIPELIAHDLFFYINVLLYNHRILKG